MKKLITTLVVLAVLLIVFLMLGPFYILEEGEQAIVTRFGKIVDYQTESGLKFKMPVVGYTNLEFTCEVCVSDINLKLSA